MAIEDYFILYLNKKKDKRLIRWLARDKNLYESTGAAMRRRLYELMRQARRGKKGAENGCKTEK